MTRESPFCKRDEIADSPTHLSRAFLARDQPEFQLNLKLVSAPRPARVRYDIPRIEFGMVQKQVTAQGWLMSTPEGDAPDPTLTRWGLAGCRQLDPQPSRSCHSRRSAC